LKRIIFLTGRPGVGKTTVLLKTIEELRDKGFKVGGMATQEVREAGSRIGFKIIDLYTGEEGWLAHVRQPEGPRVSKYRVNLGDLGSIGVNAILKALERADVTVIDEIGPMELFSEAFKEAVMKALESEKPILGTIHYRARDPLIIHIRKRRDAEIIEVREDNRDRLHNLIAQEIINRIDEG